MSVEELKQKTQTIISDLLPDVGNEEIADDTDIFGLGLDSINAMTLVFNLQDAFGIKFEASEINFENFRTVGDIVELVNQKTAVS